MVITVILILFALVFPGLFLTFRKHNSFLRKINPFIMCYVIGLILANTGLINESRHAVMEGLVSAMAILAIPFMLYTVSLKGEGRLTGAAGISMALAAVSVAVMAFFAHILWAGRLEDTDKLAAMVIGVYTGGTPNLTALYTALDVDETTYLAVNLADALCSGVFLLLIFSVGRRLFNFLLPGRKDTNEVIREITEQDHELSAEYLEISREIFRKEHTLPLLRSLGITIVILGISAGISSLVPGQFFTLAIILLVTTLSLGVSFIPAVHNTKYSFQSGEYLTYIFCIGTGSLADIRRLIHTLPPLILFVGMVLFGSLLIHILLCRIFKIDGDTMAVTATAAICSPPFVPAVAMSLGRPSLILPGISAGLAGYAAGNYLGILFSRIFLLI